MDGWLAPWESGYGGQREMKLGLDIAGRLPPPFSYLVFCGVGDVVVVINERRGFILA